MPKLKSLSGIELIKIFKEQGFIVYSQKGSHIKLRRTFGNEKQTLLIPNHKFIDKGTLKAIVRQSSRYIPGDIINKIFYTD